MYVYAQDTEYSAAKSRTYVPSQAYGPVPVESAIVRSWLAARHVDIAVESTNSSLMKLGSYFSSSIPRAS